MKKNRENLLNSKLINIEWSAIPRILKLGSEYVPTVLQESFSAPIKKIIYWASPTCKILCYRNIKRERILV